MVCSRGHLRYRDGYPPSFSNSAMRMMAMIVPNTQDGWVCISAVQAEDVTLATSVVRLPKMSPNAGRCGEGSAVVRCDPHARYSLHAPNFKCATTRT